MPVTANAGWGGDDVLAATFNQVGAFALPPASRDAALLPGAFTAQVTSTTGGSGTALVEIYDVP